MVHRLKWMLQRQRSGLPQPTALGRKAVAQLGLRWVLRLAVVKLDVAMYSLSSMSVLRCSCRWDGEAVSVHAGWPAAHCRITHVAPPCIALLRVSA